MANEQDGANANPLGRVPTNIADEMRQSYMDYAMSVIIGRALPDVRDGLKPANRRVPYGMQQMGLQPGRPYRKCAKIVGEVMGNYHPHGDAAIYDTLVRMAQPFNMRGPLVDGQGNFGSIDGDSPAAMRYTEARLSRIAEEMLRDLEKDTVDFSPNFDDTLKEPTVMPALMKSAMAISRPRRMACTCARSSARAHRSASSWTCTVTCRRRWSKTPTPLSHTKNTRTPTRPSVPSSCSISSPARWTASSSRSRLCATSG